MTEVNAGKKDLVAWLNQQHAKIMDLENNALELMHQGNIEGYREQMREKATVLAGLAEAAQQVLDNLPQETRESVKKQLEQFSRSAATSLQLNSVFYMSALLYPDDHKKGEPDNLKKYIESLE